MSKGLTIQSDSVVTIENCTISGFDEGITISGKPPNTTIKEALDSGQKAMVSVIYGGQAVVFEYDKSSNLDTLFSQLRLLLG